MPAPDRGRQADQKRRPALARGEGRGKQRRQRRHRAVHQPDQPRLNHLQHEQLPGGLGLFLLLAFRLMRRIELAGEHLVPPLGLGQIAQQLAEFRRRSSARPPGV